MDVALYAELDLGATGEGEKNGVRRVTLGKKGIKEEGRQYGSNNGGEKSWRQRGRRKRGDGRRDGGKRDWK